ncbi:ComEA family DNA-binding protein [Mangrovibacterium sp.]|uniref:ComEA family DNA-binding protein n=1 Tax=Mangrovibacterium sp. TaxID=1961364 RepID=UPI0035616646
MKRALLVILVLVSSLLARAQQTDTPLHEQLQDLLEQVLEEDENADVELLLSDLVRLEESPIAINTAGQDEFAPLFFMSPLQVQALLDYRKESGAILSVYELALVDGFNPEIAQMIAHFVDFSASLTPVKFRRTRQDLLVRGTRLIEKQAGFKDGDYSGSQEKLYLRYRLDSRVVQLGVTAEKDAGEPFFRQPNSDGFDYKSGFLRYEFGQNKNAVLVGDYVVQWGQGLAAWQGFAMGKSTDVERIARFNQGIKAYSSTDENNFMRGVAANLSLGKFQLQPFISYKKFDANVDSLNGTKVFTSIQTSGLHRTESEIEDKNSVAALVGGAHLGYRTGRLELGFSGLHTCYELPLVRQSGLYNQFLFQGSEISNFSVDYRYTFNRMYLFGEMASSLHSDVAVLNGFMFQPVGQVSLSALYRNIGKKYNSPIAAAFTENSRVNDEQGVFLGLRLLPVAKFQVKAYADFFQYKWIKYTTAAPAKGCEYMIRLDYKINHDWQIYGRYFYEQKPVKISTDVLRYDLDQIRQGARLQLSGNLNEQFSIQTRFEHSFYEHEQSSGGYLLSQDISFQTKTSNSRFWLRLAYFNTDDYDSRIYSYENDLLYQFSIPAFYGEGIRSYVNGKVKLCEKIDFWMKLSRSWYFDVNSLGSGATAIDGNTRTELKFQFRFRI